MNPLKMKPDDRKKKFFIKAARYLLQISIVGYLIYQLYQIGLSQIIDSLPRKPLFYLLYLFIYFSLPFAEVIIYKLKWPVTIKNALPVFIQKKVLNTDVLGYSGEVYLFQWAKTHLKRTTEDALHFIKDNNILSSVASTIITIILLIFFITEGYINIYDYVGEITVFNLFLAGIIAVIIGLIVYRFRNQIIALNFSDSVKIFSLHASRIVIINVVQILQWYVAIPEIPLSIWFTFSAIQILASRIPFLPSTDVLFVTVALEITETITIPQEAIVGILTANLILARILNILSYLASKIYQNNNRFLPSTDDPDITGKN